MPAKKKSSRPLENTRVRRLQRLIAPKAVKKEMPVRGASLETVTKGRARAG